MTYDIICLSHLRWNFVYQRPQHLLSRFSDHHRVYFIEEPVYEAEYDHYEVVKDPQHAVWSLVPHLAGPPADGIAARQKALLDAFLQEQAIKRYILWYYSPMALSFTDHLQPELVIYDCMDELSAFRFAPPVLKEREALLLKKADLVFTGGNSLYEAKKHLHHNIHPFPSSIDKEHFATARDSSIQPADQAAIPYPRIGFYGVLDERLNMQLIEEIAIQRPQWHLVLIGPIAKIDRSAIPAQENVHYLGSRNYKELPAYLSGWNIAMMPFALNESTKFISPTKTPEFLAGGKPVISTSINDVIHPYADLQLVHIADTADDFVKAAETILHSLDYESWLKEVDRYLENISWNKTWQGMARLIEESIEKKTILNTKKAKVYV